MVHRQWEGFNLQNPCLVLGLDLQDLVDAIAGCIESLIKPPCCYNGAVVPFPYTLLLSGGVSSLEKDVPHSTGSHTAA